MREAWLGWFFLTAFASAAPGASHLSPVPEVAAFFKVSPKLAVRLLSNYVDFETMDTAGRSEINVRKAASLELLSPWPIEDHERVIGDWESTIKSAKFPEYLAEIVRTAKSSSAELSARRNARFWDVDLFAYWKRLRSNPRPLRDLDRSKFAAGAGDTGWPSARASLAGWLPNETERVIALRCTDRHKPSVVHRWQLGLIGPHRVDDDWEDPPRGLLLPEKTDPHWSISARGWFHFSESPDFTFFQEMTPLADTVAQVSLKASPEAPGPLCQVRLYRDGGTEESLDCELAGGPGSAMAAPVPHVREFWYSIVRESLDVDHALANLFRTRCVQCHRPGGAALAFEGLRLLPDRIAMTDPGDVSLEMAERLSFSRQVLATWTNDKVPCLRNGPSEENRFLDLKKIRVVEILKNWNQAVTRESLARVERFHKERAKLSPRPAPSAPGPRVVGETLDLADITGEVPELVPGAEEIERAIAIVAERAKCSPREVKAVFEKFPAAESFFAILPLPSGSDIWKAEPNRVRHQQYPARYELIRALAEREKFGKVIPDPRYDRFVAFTGVRGRQGWFEITSEALSEEQLAHLSSAGPKGFRPASAKPDRLEEFLYQEAAHVPTDVTWSQRHTPYFSYRLPTRAEWEEAQRQGNFENEKIWLREDFEVYDYAPDTYHLREGRYGQKAKIRLIRSLSF